MSKHKLSFIETHGPFFMQGTSMGTKVYASGPKAAKLLLDDERNAVWIYYKGKAALVPCAAIASMDMAELPDDVAKALGAPVTNPTQEPAGGPVARARSGRKAKDAEIPGGESIPAGPVEVPFPSHDPDDVEAAAAHRALVRAASANANRPAPPQMQNDSLIQQARMQAMGIKTHGTAQVMTAEQVGATTLQGKPKAISHAQLQAQKAQGK